MKRVLTVASSMVLASTCLWVGVAASQETTTTTTEATTTTTAVPETTTTTTAVPEETTTTVAEETTTTVPETTTTTVPAEPLVLPGQHVTAGTLGFDIRFADTPGANCAKSIDVSGGQVNAALDEDGNVGGVYGITPSGTGTAGVFMVGLGAVPAGVGIVSVSDADCEFDAIGIGAYTSDGGYARLNGVGAGLHPPYSNAEYVSQFLVEASIGASAAPATLDLQAVSDFLLRERPGLVLPVEPVTPQ